MKKLTTLLFVALTLLLTGSAVSCSDDKEDGETSTPTLRVDELVYYQYEMTTLLAKEDDPYSGYPAESFAALKAAKTILDEVIENAENGTISSQNEVDAAASAAEAAIEIFKESFVYVERPCELFIPGAVDVANYIEFGDPGDFDDLKSISVELWFKGVEKMNMQRQGSLISNFVSPGDGNFYGWEINFWANGSDAGDGDYNLRVSRAFPEGLREPSSSYTNWTEWHHIAYTYDQGSGRTVLYVDGLEFASDNTSGEPIPPGYEVQMCGMKSLTNPGSPKAVSGSIKNVRFWNKALSAAEVVSMMDTEITGSEEGLVAAWDFTTLPDNPDAITDKTGNYTACVKGDKVEWRTQE